MSGLRIIAGAISLFERIIAKLSRGIEKCKVEISEKEEIISKNSAEKVELEKAIVRAEKVLKNIKDIIE